ncbi:Alpha/Beta hydrolase protein [Xylariales sp. AK1849]|nr:Alpha/Beta hydrolase protein [Xylariales sp. AK1849]
MSVHAVTLAGPSGSLELLYSLPNQAEGERPPLLFIHGAYCSAHCYMYFLPYFASHGFPAYAVSVRGHGASQAQGKLKTMLFTSMYSWAEDTQTALAHITATHPDAPSPVLGAHSLGGGAVQFMASSGLLDSGKPDAAGRISGLILLGASPLSGGCKEIMANWEKVEAPEGYAYFWSERSQLNTTGQVRAAFFSEDAEMSVVKTWLEKCKTAEESARVGLSILWPVGEAKKVLNNVEGIGPPEKRRKVLCIAGTADKLILPSMVKGNAEAYETAATADGMGDETCTTMIVENSAHHFMMDARWDKCAEGILKWLEGEEMPA